MTTDPSARSARQLASRLRRNARRIRTDGLHHLVKVASHPRSGTHLMEAFLAQNFYPERDLAVRPVRWGHWSDPQIDEQGNQYGKLFGGHGLANPVPLGRAPAVYIYRDGRAVARSIWRSPHFLSQETKSRLTFSQFLARPLDWFCAPEIRAVEPMTVAQHWHRHVTSWLELASSNPRILVVRYEQLVLAPDLIHADIHRMFFAKQPRGSVTTIEKRIGLAPNDGQVESWREAFTDDDNAAFCEQLPDTSLLWS